MSKMSWGHACRLCTLAAVSALAVGCGLEGEPGRAEATSRPTKSAAAPAAKPAVAPETPAGGAPRTTAGRLPQPTLLDPAKMQLQSGFAYWIKLPDEWLPYTSDATDPMRSSLVVEEDGEALGPANVPLVKVQSAGRGSFLHWGSWVYFSSSDNTDPRFNGRKYTVRLAQPG